MITQNPKQSLCYGNLVELFKTIDFYSYSSNIIL